MCQGSQAVAPGTLPDSEQLAAAPPAAQESASPSNPSDLQALIQRLDQALAGDGQLL